MRVDVEAVTTVATGGTFRVLRGDGTWSESIPYDASKRIQVTAGRCQPIKLNLTASEPISYDPLIVMTEGDWRG